MPWARYYPHGMLSGKNKEDWDPTVFWLFNSACCIAMLDHLGFEDLQIVSDDPQPFVVSARSLRAVQKRAAGPDPSSVVLILRHCRVERDLRRGWKNSWPSQCVNNTNTNAWTKRSGNRGVCLELFAGEPAVTSRPDGTWRLLRQFRAMKPKSKKRSAFPCHLP